MDALPNDLGLTSTAHACACGGGGCGGDSLDAASAESESTHLLVTGMTCAHCVSSVTEEVSAVDGVDSVSIQLNVGGASEVTVVTSMPVALRSIQAAIAEAGYEVVTAQP